MPAAPASLPLSTLIARARADGDALHFEIDAGWLQGRSAFGGLVAALGVHALRERLRADGIDPPPLRALQTSFVAPVDAGVLEVHAQRLRSGRSAHQAMAQLRQGGQVRSVLLAVFAAERDSAIEPLHPRRPADVPPAEALPSVPYVAGAAPPFLQHFEMRWAGGPPPYSGGRGHTNQMHLRLRDPAPQVVDDELLAVLLADVAPTPVIGQPRERVPASSVTWALELRTDPYRRSDPLAWWRADTEALAVDGGLVNQAARLWAPDGRLAALGTQLVAVFG